MLSDMRGISYSDDEKFLRFFALVQDEAAKLGQVFFISNAERHDCVLEDLYLTEMCGWLVPVDRADEFEGPWEVEDDSIWEDGWGDYFVFEDFDLRSDGEIKITFRRYLEDRTLEITPDGEIEIWRSEAAS